MVLKRAFLAAALLLILLLSLLLHSPARVLSGLLPSTLPVDAWGGTLLSGQLSGRYQQQPVFLTWNWHPSALWRLALGFDASLQGPVDAQVDVLRGQRSWRLRMPQLHLPAGPGDWLGRGTVLPAWQGSDLEFSRRRGGDWLVGSGTLTSPGGPMRLSLQGQVQAVVLPAAKIVWSVKDGVLVGDLRQIEGNAALATLSLTGNNRIQWQIRDRLLRLKSGYVSQNDPNLVVLTVSEPL